MSMATPSVGETVKVWLPGESPWAECVAVLGDGSWIGRLDNDLVNTVQHGLRLNSVTRFVLENPFDDVWLWQVNTIMGDA